MLEEFFSIEPVGGINVKRVYGSDYTQVIEMAKEMKGFDLKKKKEEKETGGKLDELMIGFARQTVLGVAGKVIDGVKSGELKRIFLIGGCDGFEKERNQYTDFAEKVPADCFILTLACSNAKRVEKIDQCVAKTFSCHLSLENEACSSARRFRSK